MTTESPQAAPPHPLLRILRRKNVLAGLMFIGIAAFGLWVSRNYPIGTAWRMNTGYVPRLLCWILMGLGAIVFLQGLRERDGIEPAPDPARSVWTQLRPILVVTAGLIAFGVMLERLGLVLSILLLVVIASFATRELKFWETLAAAGCLIVMTWTIFIFGLGLTLPVWPDW
jgi:putative tricarboxylic transport membrane protein